MVRTSGVDKLYVSVPEVLNLDELQPIVVRMNLHPRGFGYQSGWECQLGKREIYVYPSPFHQKTQFQFNLTQWSSLEGFLKFLEKVLGPHLVNASIDRLTYFTELEEEITEVIPHLLCKRKQTTEKLHSIKKRGSKVVGGGLTFKSGARASGVVQVYQAEAVHGGAPRTRISLEFEPQAKVKMPIDHPFGLKGLMQRESFKDHVVYANVQFSRDLIDSEPAIISQFDEVRAEEGISPAINSLRKSVQNFDRKYLLTKKIEIQETTRLDDQFKGDLVGFVTASPSQEEHDFYIDNIVRIPKQKVLRKQKTGTPKQKTEKQIVHSIRSLHKVLNQTVSRTGSAYQELYDLKDHSSDEAKEIWDTLEKIPLIDLAVRDMLSVSPYSELED